MADICRTDLSAIIAHLEDRRDDMRLAASGSTRTANRVRMIQKLINKLKTNFKKMRKNELAKELAVSEGLHLSTAVKAIDGIIRIVKESLAKGEELTLRGFGTLAVAQRAERSGVDFKTNQPIRVPARNIVKFKASKELNDAINNE